MLNDAPSDWQRIRLDQVMRRDTSSISARQLEELPFVEHYSIPAHDDGKKPRLEAGYEIKSNKTIVPENSLLFSKLNPRIPRVWRVRMLSDYMAVCSTEYWTFQPKTEDISLDYFSFFFTWSNFLNHPQIKPASSTNSHQRIDRKDFDAFLLALPPFFEQERIAEMLSSVDESIRAAEAVITQAERVKCGLIEDLLTGGLSDDATKDWVSTVLRNVIVSDTTKWDGDSKEVPYVGLEHIGQDSGNLVGLGSAAEVVSAKNIFRVGDVLFGKLRPNLKKYWQAEFEGICSTDILVLRPLGSISNEYLYYLVQSHPFLSLAISDAVGTKMPRTSWKRLGGFEFLLPPLPEQRRIAEILSSVDDQIVANRASADQLRRLKRGLMDDLLTGRVRTVS